MRALTLFVYATNDMSEYVEDSLEVLALLLRDLPLWVSVLISIDVVVKDLLHRKLMTKGNHVFAEFPLSTTI